MEAVDELIGLLAHVGDHYKDNINDKVPGVVFEFWRYLVRKVKEGEFEEEKLEELYKSCRVALANDERFRFDSKEEKLMWIRKMDGLEKEISSHNTAEEIASTNPIKKYRGHVIKRRSDIKEWVEGSLLKACEIFYDKNIQTISTSANRNDIGREGRIDLEYTGLSEENKEIAKEVGRLLTDGEGFKSINISIPVNKRTTRGEVERYSVRIAQEFKKQEMTWAPTHSLNDLLEGYRITYKRAKELGITSRKKLIEWGRKIGLFWDEEEGLFYESEEHYRKVKGLE